jgi:AhpD family alkylhydroperoxidase
MSISTRDVVDAETNAGADPHPHLPAPAPAPSHGPLLAPVRHVRSVAVRLFAALFRRQFGKTMTPIGVIYARMPRLLWPQVMMVRLAQGGLSLDPTLVDLVQIRVSLDKGCTFCTDLHRAAARRSGRAAAKLAAVDDPAASGALTAQERVALAFAGEVTRGGTPGAATFAAARSVFDEKQIVELVWLCAFTGYLAGMARALGIESDGFCDLR